MNVEKFKALESIRMNHPDKRLIPSEVVNAAKDETHPLHEDFTWDDSEAAKKFRDQEARTLIRAFVTFEPRIQRDARAFISVPTDRTEGGGYRSIGDVLDRPDYVAQITEEVRLKIRSLRTTYKHIKPLDDLWTGIENLADQFINARKSEAA